MSKQTKPCAVPLSKDRFGLPDREGPCCTYPRKRTKTACEWHWLLKQPIEVQVKAAAVRLRDKGAAPVRMRVPEAEWPAGERWCSGCQSFVPLFYCQGSRCRGCASKANHASHVERTYGITGEQYQQLLDWQGGRCFICGQVPRVRRLAVDHDHRTGRVRGLLCANDEHGCNMQLRRLLNDVEMARRALEYVELHPLDRMLQGEPPRGAPAKTEAWRGADWDPWAA